MVQMRIFLWRPRHLRIGGLALGSLLFAWVVRAQSAPTPLHERGFALLHESPEQSETRSMSAKTPTATVTVSNDAPFYLPTTILIDVGGTIEWVNSEHGQTHSIGAEGGAFVSPDLTPNTRWSYRFQREGEYAYRCRFHPWMHGKVIVRAKTLNATQLRVNGLGRSSFMLINPADSTVWLVAPGKSDSLVQLQPESVNTVHLPLSAHGATTFSFDRSGNLWFVPPLSERLFELEFHGRAAKAVILGREGATLSSIAAGDNGLIWFFDAHAKSFGTLDSKTASVVVHGSVKLNSEPMTLLFGSDQKLWFIEKARNCVGTYDPKTGRAKEFFLHPTADVRDLREAAGTLWFTDAGRNKLIKLKDGWTTEYTLPTSYSKPQGLAIDQWGDVWFAETSGNRIGLLHADGVFDEYLLPNAGSRPTWIGFDGRGDLFFIEEARGTVGKLSAPVVRALAGIPGREGASSSLDLD